MADDIREELAKVIDPEAWLLRWSSERRRDERQFAAREIADAVLASPVIARIRAEASRAALTEARDRYVENSVPWIQFERALERLSIRSEPLGASSPRSNPDGSEEDR